MIAPVVPPQLLSVIVAVPFRVGRGLMIREMFPVPEQPLLSVPVMRYPWAPLRVIDAVTLDPVVTFSPVEGIQVYSLAPAGDIMIAVNAVELPAQVVTSDVIMVGVAVTETFTGMVLIQPNISVAVMVYPCTPLRMRALAVTLVPVVTFRPAEGDQL